MRTILSVTAAAAGDGTCNLHLRWSDADEQTIGQNDVVGLYGASEAQRVAAAPKPNTNSAPWLDWFLSYAPNYDAAHGAPPPGYVAPVVESVVADLFPSEAEGIPPVTDARVLRRRQLQEMEPPEYKAVAKGLGIRGFSRLLKADLIEAVIVAEFDAVAGEPQSDQPADHEPAEGAEGGPPAEGEENRAESMPTEADRLIAEAVARVLAPGTNAQILGRLAWFGQSPQPSDVAILQAVIRAEQARRRPRQAIVAFALERIQLLSPTVVEPEAESVAVEPVPGIVDGPVRAEVDGEGLGGVGVEMGGGMGLGGGVELGGLGTGAGELTGGLAGESIGMGGEGRDAPPAVSKRDGAGCKQPDKVDGWEAGRVLVVVKPHRGEFRAWGTCEYRVRCDEDGGYTLLKLTGNRAPSDAGGLFEGKRWAYVSLMLTDLMGIPLDAKGRPTRHHRMTLRRWFALNRTSSS